MSKYVKQGETPVKYECTKRKCKWQGTYDEKSEKKNRRRLLRKYLS